MYILSVNSCVRRVWIEFIHFFYFFEHFKYVLQTAITLASKMFQKLSCQCLLVIESSLLYTICSSSRAIAQCGTLCLHDSILCFPVKVLHLRLLCIFSSMYLLRPTQAFGIMRRQGNCTMEKHKNWDTAFKKSIKSFFFFF